MKRGPAPFKRQSWRASRGDIEQPGRLGRPEQFVLTLNAARGPACPVFILNGAVRALCACRRLLALNASRRLVSSLRCAPLVSSAPLRFAKCLRSAWCAGLSLVALVGDNRDTAALFRA
jgi:hypothetical protein